MQKAKKFSIDLCHNDTEFQIDILFIFLCQNAKISIVFICDTNLNTVYKI